MRKNRLSFLLPEPAVSVWFSALPFDSLNSSRKVCAHAPWTLRDLARGGITHSYSLEICPIHFKFCALSSSSRPPKQKRQDRCGSALKTRLKIGVSDQSFEKAAAVGLLAPRNFSVMLSLVPSRHCRSRGKGTAATRCLRRGHLAPPSSASVSFRPSYSVPFGSNRLAMMLELSGAAAPCAVRPLCSSRFASREVRC